MRFSGEWLWQSLLLALLGLAFAFHPTRALAQQDSESDEGESSDEDEDETTTNSGESVPSKGEESSPMEPSGTTESPGDGEDGAAAEDGVDSANTPRGPRTASPKASAGKATAEFERGDHRFAAGFRGTGLAALRPGAEPGGLGGLGVFAELMAVRGELELELGARVLTDGEGLQVPVELLLKKPWDLARARLYIGVGPAVVVAVPLPPGEVPEADGPQTGQGAAPSAAEAHFGFSGVAGVTYWVRERVGLNVELNYNIVLQHGPVHQVGSSAGLLFVL